jgi:hypothetical protein
VALGIPGSSKVNKYINSRGCISSAAFARKGKQMKMQQKDVLKLLHLNWPTESGVFTKVDVGLFKQAEELGIVKLQKQLDNDDFAQVLKVRELNDHEISLIALEEV